MSEMFRCWTKKQGMLRVDQINFEMGTIRVTASECDGGGWRNIYKVDVNNEKALRGKPFYCALMRNTGLKDKNGNETWEGDIFERNGHYGQVVYSNGRYIVIFDDNKVINLLVDSKWNWHLEEAEIIGNIYENPELISRITGEKSVHQQSFCGEKNG